jgi:NADH:ubiquinone oxidoreductase subunit 6 (subunit J)
VHSVLFLVLAFLTTSGILFTLHLEFVPLIFIIVYVGAIAVLFLFVVMMLDIKLTSKTNDLFKYIPFGFLVGSFFILEILYVLNDDFCAPQKLINEDFFFWFMCVDTISNIECLGQLLYTYYFIYFLVSGMILLVAMVGSIVLTLNPNKKVKSQTLYKQLSRSANKAIFLARN